MKKLVLAIGAHPDDIEIGCGGTLCLLRDQGYEIVHLIVTSGEEGSTTLGKTELSQLRKNEARRAADMIGAKDVIFLGAEDGLTDYSKGLKTRLIAILRELRPEIVFTHSGSDHLTDHKVVHELTVASVTASAGPWYQEAGDRPHSVQKMFGYEVWSPIPAFQVAIDIGSVLNRKTKALEQHSSQIQDVDYLNAIVGLAQYRGVMSMTGSHAEVFEVLKTGPFL